MKMRDSDVFDEAVAEYFAPIAREFNLSLSKIKEGVHEIDSPHFILRIRLDTGHASGLNVILRPAYARNFDENKLGFGLGIGNFVLFNGQQFTPTMIDALVDYRAKASLLAQFSRQYLVCYLLGQKNDYAAVEEMVEKRHKEYLEKNPWLARYRPIKEVLSEDVQEKLRR